jgi:membrane associated rhomboid family serine protease
MAASTGSLVFTRFSKVLAVVLVAGYAVVVVHPPALELLALIPGRTLPLVWNLFTAGLVHKSLTIVSLNVVALLLLSRVVEPYYGSREYLKLLAIVNLLTNFATFVTMFLLFIGTQKGNLLYVKLAGFHGVIGGILVAVKQVMPHHEYKLLGFLAIKAHALPSLFLLFSIPACIATGNSYDVLFLVYGTYFSWLYLRFFQQQSELPVTGDASEDFKFSSFFPPFLAAPVDRLAAVFSTIFRLKHTSPVDSARFATLPTSSVGPDASETNRRRERGAKALEERLKKTAVDPEQGSPKGNGTT